MRPDAGVTEVVLIVPVLLTLVVVIVQFGLYFHASQIALAAAQDAAGHARTDGATLTAGRDLAQKLLDDTAPTLIEDERITVGLGRADGVLDPAGTFVVVDVTGEVASIVPFLRLRVHAREVAPTERFIPQPDR